MKLEALLAIAVSCFHPCSQPVVPHPIPYIECVEDDVVDEGTSTITRPTITITYNNSTIERVTGCKYVSIPSRTQGGSLRIELDSPSTITDYIILLDCHHLACSNDAHPSQLPKSHIMKQYAVPLYGHLLVGVRDEKGNTSRAVIIIEREH